MPVVRGGVGGSGPPQSRFAQQLPHRGRGSGQGTLAHFMGEEVCDGRFQMLRIWQRSGARCAGGEAEGTPHRPHFVRALLPAGRNRKGCDAVHGLRFARLSPGCAPPVAVDGARVWKAGRLPPPEEGHSRKSLSQHDLRYLFTRRQTCLTKPEQECILGVWELAKDWATTVRQWGCGGGERG